MLLLVSAALTFQAPAVPNSASYAAAGKLSPAQGSLSFWWKPEADGAVFQITPKYPVTPADVTLRVTNFRGLLRLQLRDRNLRDGFGELVRVPAGRMHVAVTWSELSGAAFYVDGQRRAAVPGPVFLRSELDGISFRAGAVEDLRIYSGPLDVGGVEQLARREEPALPELNPPPAAAARYGWHAAGNIPHGSGFRVRKIAVKDARAVKRFWWKLVDGRRDTVWPSPAPDWAYRDERSHYEIRPAAEPFNVVRTVGDAEAQLDLGDLLVSPRPGNVGLHYFNFHNPLLIEAVRVDVRNGVLAEVECLRVEPLGERELATNVIPLPAARESAVRGVRVEIDAIPAQYYHFAVADPGDDGRKAIEFDARANAARMTVELEFAPYVLRAGQAMRLEASGPVKKVEWLGADLEASRAADAERRELELRDLVQSRPDAAPLTEWTEPAPPAGVPRWAWQQIKVVERVRELADWWIDNRQSPFGEFGNGPAADAVLGRMFPAVARLGGGAAKYREATRALYAANPAALWTAFELDPGRPELAEAAMEWRRVGGRVPEPRAAVAGEVGELWRWIEQRFGWLTKAEPQNVEVDLSTIERARLGPNGEVSWQGTGGQVAASVDEVREDGLRLRVFNASESGRRVRMAVHRLPHGRYDLAMEGEAVRQVTVKPGTYVDLDLPAGRVVRVDVKLVERRRPVSEMPDLAIDAFEITADARGLSIPVHNLGAAPAGRFQVQVKSAEGRVLAEAFYEGLDAPRDLRPRILVARFAELQATPGYRVEVHSGAGEESVDTNNSAVIPAKPAFVVPNSSRMAPAIVAQ